MKFEFCHALSNCDACRLQNNPYCSHQQSSIIGQDCYCNQTCVVPNGK